MVLFILYVFVSIMFFVVGYIETDIIKLVCSLVWMFGGGIQFSKWLIESVMK